MKFRLGFAETNAGAQQTEALRCDACSRQDGFRASESEAERDSLRASNGCPELFSDRRRLFGGLPGNLHPRNFGYAFGNRQSSRARLES